MTGSSPRRRRSDEEIVAGVRAGTEELFGRLGSAFAAAPPGWVNQLRAVGWELRRFLCEDEERARLMMIEVLDGPPEAIAIREEGMRALAGILDLARAEIEDPSSVSPVTAEITAGVIYNRIHAGVERGVETLDGNVVRELMFTAVLPFFGMDAAVAELGAPEPELRDGKLPGGLRSHDRREDQIGDQGRHVG